jgi:hypothetical protein
MRTFILATVGAVIFFVAAPFAQAPNKGTIPDFSGVWAHPSSPGFEPLATGPGPVLYGSLHDNYHMMGDHTNPILKPKAAEVVKEFGKASLAGFAHPTPSTHCWPSGVPYIFFQLGLQIVQQAHTITFLYLRDHEFRHVRLNEPHPARLTPSWNGDSVGHYEGDVLVIDTIGVKTNRPLAMVDMFGTPYSQNLHIVERYRLLDYEAAKDGLERDARANVTIPNTTMQLDRDYRGNYLQLFFTVEDKGVFTTPWSATVTYGRPLGEWEEHVCVEGAQNQYYFPVDKAVFPTADKPDF